MLPIATPPNAVIFATEKIKLIDMIKTEIILNFISIIIISTFVILYLLWPATRVH